MAASLNKVTIIGNCGKDPEIRSTSDGREIASLSIATSESWNDKVSGEKKEKTEWHRVAVFNEPLVKVIKNYVKKGSSLYLEGSLQTRKWQDASGQDRYTTEIILQGYNATLKILNSRNVPENGDPHDPNNPSTIKNFEHNELDDEIPF
ncbi:MAG: single-stranded DNA-binding protein [Rickettsiaceae bacterium]|nr:single-stranded DNA-binding protein [Rickettsiaceae bacterium]